MACLFTFSFDDQKIYILIELISLFLYGYGFQSLFLKILPYLKLPYERFTFCPWHLGLFFNTPGVDFVMEHSYWKVCLFSSALQCSKSMGLFLGSLLVPSACLYLHECHTLVTVAL